MGARPAGRGGPRVPQEVPRYSATPAHSAIVMRYFSELQNIDKIVTPDKENIFVASNLIS